MYYRKAAYSFAFFVGKGTQRKTILKEMFPVYSGKCLSRKALRNLQTMPDQVMTLAGKVMLTVFWDYQGVLLGQFQKPGENTNSGLYSEVSLKLRDEINRKHPDQLTKNVLLHHDNGRPHTARATQERIQELQLEHLEHPPYSPDLAPSDLHPFGLLKDHLGGKCFADDEEVETEVRKWLRQ
jgi:histone-lysine N-methyltransferase SETMAR